MITMALGGGRSRWAGKGLELDDLQLRLPDGIAIKRNGADSALWKDDRSICLGNPKLDWRVGRPWPLAFNEFATAVRQYHAK